MSRCKMLEKALKSGCFNECIRDVSDRMQQHLSACPTCKELYDDLVRIENAALDTDPIELSPRARARIRTNVTHALSIRKSRVTQWLKPAIGAAFVTLIAFFLVIHPFDRQPSSLESSPVQTVNDNTIADILSLANIDMYLYDDADLETAVIMQSDNELISDALKTISASTPYTYDETVYMALSDLNEKEWNLLRRYLM